MSTSTSITPGKDIAKDIFLGGYNKKICMFTHNNYCSSECALYDEKAKVCIIRSVFEKIDAYLDIQVAKEIEM
ncbi:MAG: hypothetical protein QW575_06280 [Thermoproteota archaeon]